MIRSDLPTEGDLPIVGVTASVLREDRAACISSGMDDVLAKPYRAESLRSILNTYAGRPRRAATPEPGSLEVDTAFNGDRTPSSAGRGHGADAR
jgi:DNA-binding response OmpR family regulator